MELWSKETPLACRNFVQLCMEGYYNGNIFHRIVRGSYQTSIEQTHSYFLFGGGGGGQACETAEVQENCMQNNVIILLS